jgi:hypothetical protein
MQRPNDPPAERITLIIDAVREVAPPDHPAPRGMNQGSIHHRRLFDEYLPALRQSRERAERRWNGLIERLMERTGVDRDRALRDVWARSPAGPGTNPDFLATIRRYWLKCAELNDDVPRDERVPPEEFIVRWPAEAGADACVDVLTRLTYMPVGLNKEGRWV